MVLIKKAAKTLYCKNEAPCLQRSSGAGRHCVGQPRVRNGTSSASSILNFWPIYTNFPQLYHLEPGDDSLEFECGGFRYIVPSRSIALLLLTIVGSIISGTIWEVVGCLMLFYVVFFFSTIGSVLVYILPFAIIIIVVNIIKGLSIGVLSTVIPIYIRETAPSDKTGRVMTIFQIFVGLGSALSFTLGAIAQNLFTQDKGFKIVYLSQIVPVVLLIIFGLAIPESPKWLATHSQWKEVARHLEAIEKSYPNSNMNILSSCLTKSTKSSKYSGLEYLDFKDLFSQNLKKKTIRALTLYVLLQGLCIGLLPITFVFVCEACGLGRQASMVLASLQYIIFIVFNGFPLFLLDKCRRRDSLIFGTLLLGATLSSLCFMMIKFGVIEETYTIVKVPFNYKYSSQAASGILALFLFIPAIYATTISSASLVYVGELFPDIAKSKAYSLCICASWIMNTITSFLYPTLSKVLGPWLLLCIGIMSIFIGFVLIFYPETIEQTDNNVDILNYYTSFNKQKSHKKLGDLTLFSEKESKSKSPPNKTSLETDPSSYEPVSHSYSKSSSRIEVPTKFLEHQFTTAQIDLDSVETKSPQNEPLTPTGSVKVVDFTNTNSSQPEQVLRVVNGPITTETDTERLSLVVEKEDVESDFDYGIIDDYVNDGNMAMVTAEASDEFSDAAELSEEMKNRESYEWFESGKDSGESKPVYNEMSTISPGSESPIFLKSLKSTKRNYKGVDRAKLKGGLFIGTGHRSVDE